MQYMTRHLTALRPLRYMGRVLVAGESFETDDVGADYFLSRKVAKEGGGHPSMSLSEPQAAVPAKRGRGRPRKNPA